MSNPHVKSFENPRTGTKTHSFCAPAESTEAVNLIGIPPESNMQPAGDSNISTPAPVRSVPQLRVSYHEDPTMNELLRQVAAVGGNPDTFLANISKTDGPLALAVKETEGEYLGAPGIPETAGSIVEEGDIYTDATRNAALNDAVELTAEEVAARDAQLLAERRALKAQQGVEIPGDDAAERTAAETHYAELVELVGAGPAGALRGAGLASVAAAQTAPEAQLRGINGVSDKTIAKLKAEQS